MNSIIRPFASKLMNTSDAFPFATPEADEFHALSATDAQTMAAMRAQLAPIKGQMSGPQARDAFDQFVEQTPAAPGVTLEAATVGGVTGLWCHPPDERAGAVIAHYHGGAYIVGSPRGYRNFGGQIAARTGLALFLPDYALAPERVFPAALEDAKAVYRGLSEAGYTEIIVTGDSAGGGLALALLQSLSADANANAISPRAGVLLSPWADLTLSGDSIQTRAEQDPLLTREMLARASALYLDGNDGNDARDPRASPLFGEMRGLPPLQFHVGTSEILLDDTRRLAQRARAAGVEVSAHIWDGMPHVFPASLGALEAAETALQTMTEWMRGYL